MSIQTELTRITNAKAAIKAAIEGKGVTVPDGTLLDGMASLIESIEAGGGGSGIVYTSGTLVFSSNTTCDGYVITHDLGTIPQIFIISIQYSASGDYGLMHHFVISEGLRNMGYSADKYCFSFFNNGVGVYKRQSVASNKNYTIDENTITIMGTNNGVFLSGMHYSWQAIGGIAV